ncbi:MAG TPA: tRNA lysidine(34) synthetase TilS [Vicinamibacterales bacterium]
MNVTSRALDTIHRHALLRDGDRVLVALSGGSDSVALLRILRELEDEGRFAVAGAAHLNHGLRPSAEDDERFCRATAETLGVPFRSERIDVRALAASCGISIEDAGRRARYEMFDRVAGELGASAIATGHTRDDQAETFLLRLLRGAGPRGLGGIHPQVVSSLPSEAPLARRTVRPLIEIGRDELRAYLDALAQPYREDETNADVAIPRNRVRHELLPFIEARFAPEIRAILAREAAIARHDEDRLQGEAIDLARSIVLRNEKESTVQIDVPALRSLHPALAGRVARLALEAIEPGRFVGYEHIERLLELAASPHERGSVSLPGQHVERRGSRLVLSREPSRPFSNSFRVSLSIPGEVVLPDHGWAVSAAFECVSVELGSDPSNSAAGFAVKVRGVTPPLTVRSRQPGDRYRPLGMGGRSKKLQDILVDRKIARTERDSLPLVVDGSERIVWIVGEPAAEDFRVTEPSQGVIFLKARRLGGQG